MAERRMFAKTVIDSDAFLDMPLSTQALYFHLSMRADDDGFINNPKKVQRMVGASDDDLKLLVAKRFIIPFDSGIVVIKHWKIHNYIRNDRYKPTVYEEEKAQIQLKENGAYTIGIPSDNQVVYQMDTQVRLGKDSIGKVSIDKDIYKDRQTDYISLAYKKYYGREITENEHEVITAYLSTLGCRSVDEEKELLEIALSTAVNSGTQKNMNYIAAIFRAWKTKGIKCADDYWEAEAERDIANGRI
jgi:DnaD/phage-associated family protein